MDLNYLLKLYYSVIHKILFNFIHFLKFIFTVEMSNVEVTTVEMSGHAANTNNDYIILSLTQNNLHSALGGGRESLLMFD